MAATVAALVLVVAGLGWLVLSGDPSPARFRLALPEDGALLYLVESTANIQTEIRGTELEVTTEMDGLLDMSVRRIKGSTADVMTELSVFSYAAHGTVLDPPKLWRRPMRVGSDGRVMGGMFSTREGYPLLLIPALTPILPEGLMEPGEVRSVDAVRLLGRGDERMTGETRFVRWVDEEETLAQLEGTLYSDFSGDEVLGSGDLRIALRATFDPATGTIREAEGTVYTDSVLGASNRSMTVTESFRIVPAPRSLT